MGKQGIRGVREYPELRTDAAQKAKQLSSSICPIFDSCIYIYYIYIPHIQYVYSIYRQTLYGCSFFRLI